MDEVEPQKSGISRRTVTKAMAWAVPAIAIAAPAPAFALSGDEPLICAGEPFKVPGNSGCKAFDFGGNEVEPGNGFGFPLQVTNNTGQVIYIDDPMTVTILTRQGNTPVVLVFPIVSTSLPLPATLQPNDSITIYAYFNDTNSGGYTGRVRISVSWGHPPAPDPSNHPPVILEFCVTSDQWHPATSEQCQPTFDFISGGCSTDAPPIVGACRGED
jgi:hypothetical protein